MGDGIQKWIRRGVHVPTSGATYTRWRGENPGVSHEGTWRRPIEKPELWYQNRLKAPDTYLRKEINFHVILGYSNKSKQ